MRYLSDEPVLARPPSPSYRFRKFARRNKAAIATAAVLTAALVLGTAVSTWQAFRATRAESRAHSLLQDEKMARQDAEAARRAEAAQREIAEKQRAEAEQLRQQAEANFRQARRAVDDMYTQVAEKWLANQPQMEAVQREFLQKALEFYAEFARESGDDPTIPVETARAYRRVTEIQIKLGETTPPSRPPRRHSNACRNSSTKLLTCPNIVKTWRTASINSASCSATLAGESTKKPRIARRWPSRRNWPPSSRTSPSTAAISAAGIGFSVACWRCSGATPKRIRRIARPCRFRPGW